MIHVQTQIGSLRCEVLQDAPEGTVPELIVILCHGFGAPGNDLVPLAPELFQSNPELKSKVRFIFPEGPLSLSEYGYGPARAWWHVDMTQLAALRRLPERIPEGLPQARRALMGVVEEVCRQTQRPPSRVVLGGFSQGAMVTMDVALRMEESPLGLVALSGNLVSVNDWKPRAEQRTGLRVFQSHGRQDPILPYEGAEALRDVLVAAGLSVEFHGFDGGHTIPYEVLRALGTFLSRA